eukprot:Opistho-1_new@103226
MPYDKKAIASIRPKLETAWANLFGDSSDDSFWGHEWGRHGTCSLDIVSKEIEYFEAALELRSRYDFAAALSSNGVSPSSSKTYTVNDIVLACAQGSAQIRSCGASTTRARASFSSRSACASARTSRGRSCAMSASTTRDRATPTNPSTTGPCRTKEAGDWTALRAP